MKITYWSDYACPYCYIGETRLKKAIAAVPEAGSVELEMKAFQLDPTAGKHASGDTQTRFAHKYGISFEDAGKRIATISKMGNAEGIDFKYASTLFTNTMDAHRLTKLAQSKKDPEISEKVIESLFKAYFSDNKELADKELLQSIGEDCSLDPDEVRDVLAGDEYKEEVIRDEREADTYGIHAVPFFVIGEYGISGAQSVKGMESVIRRVLEEQTVTVPDQGNHCGPEGCRI